MTPPTAQPATAGRAPALPGRPFPLGRDRASMAATNFAVGGAPPTASLVCLFDEGGAETRRSRCGDYDAGVWHGFLPAVGAGQAYGYRAAGPVTIRGTGLRFNPAKLLLDPVRPGHQRDR